MKAIILAAGQGTRLRPLTDSIPKCLLQIDNRPILDYQIDTLSSHGVDEIILVTGFMGERVREHCSNKENITLITNPLFKTTEAVYSLFLGKEHMGDDVIILDGDLLFHPDMLTPLLCSKESSVLVDFNREQTKEDLKVIASDGRIIDLSKDIEGNGIWVSLALFKGEFLERFKELIGIEKYWNKWWSIPIREHLLSYELRSIDTGGLPWVEIDTIDDLNYAENVVLPQIGELHCDV